MQYLIIEEYDTLVDIARIVGQNNIDTILAENSLPRTPKLGEAYKAKCDQLLATNPPEVTASRKSALLNNLTGSAELFERACLMDEDEWKIFSAFGSFPDRLKVPESIQLPGSVRVIGSLRSVEETAYLGRGTRNVSSDTESWISGQSSSASSSGTTSSSSYNSSVYNRSPSQLYNMQTSATNSSNSDPVNSVTYRAVMKQLKTSSKIDPSIFETVNTAPAHISNNIPTPNTSSSALLSYNLPWGKIQMYSTVLDSIIDFPVYPEQIEQSRVANYDAMPDIIYQYEPWIVYKNSGPREQSLSFHLHRDLWTGNHLDGNANKLIKFCEANTFPTYSGSIVNAPKVRLYFDGSLFISGVITNTLVNWQGPIGLDNWYLEFTLSLTIQEVSDVPLDATTVYSMGIKGF